MNTANCPEFIKYPIAGEINYSGINNSINDRAPNFPALVKIDEKCIADEVRIIDYILYRRDILIIEEIRSILEKCARSAAVGI